MQLDYALDKSKLDEHFPFARLSNPANILIFPDLGSANAAYRVLKASARPSAVGPILPSPIDKPVAVLQNESSVDDIVTMTAYTVLHGATPRRARAGLTVGVAGLSCTLLSNT